MEFLKDIAYEIRHIDRNPRLVRRFGFILTTLLLVIGLYLWYHGNPAWMWLAGGGAVSGLLSFFRPGVIQPFYVGLTALTIPIGYFVSKLLLTMMFVLFFTPVGILSRIFGRDLLGKKIDKKAATYWLPKERDPAPPSERYERLF